jgi:hypothetical protein
VRCWVQPRLGPLQLAPLSRTNITTVTAIRRPNTAMVLSAAALIEGAIPARHGTPCKAMCLCLATEFRLGFVSRVIVVGVVVTAGRHSRRQRSAYPYHRDDRRLGEGEQGRKIMAKSQLRSGREPKKPKKEKVKAAPASTSLWSTLEKQPSHDKKR